MTKHDRPVCPVCKQMILYGSVQYPGEKQRVMVFHHKSVHTTEVCPGSYQPPLRYQEAKHA